MPAVAQPPESESLGRERPGRTLVLPEAPAGYPGELCTLEGARVEQVSGQPRHCSWM